LKLQRKDVHSAVESSLTILTQCRSDQWA